MEKEIILQKNPDIVTRVIEDETILMPVYKTSNEINCIYTLNKTATEVWNLIDGKISLAGIKDKILQRFDTTPQEVDQEMEGLLKDLKEIKAITEK
ncbi:MAG: PqqD family protein [Candidatus Omnitrophota bacterium]